MKAITKNDLRNFCMDNNIFQPRFSGRKKIVYIDPNVTYTIQQNLHELCNKIGYKLKFCKFNRHSPPYFRMFGRTV